MAVNNYDTDVFINCPFDDDFKQIFYAIVFTVFDCGFRARCSLEEDDGGGVRIEKISNIIHQSKYGIHDISRTELCNVNKLPRFNMPLELGLFLGAKRFGDRNQQKKICLITDTERYRYQKYISDISGQDIKAHNNNHEAAICTVCNWLRSASKKTTIPGGKEIIKRYKLYRIALPKLCQKTKIEQDEITFNDHATFISEWLKVNAR